ncbi:salt tolerance down-regulator-domain-containing protein [Mycena capillaripes]|nr:salt tolerance down-regulator-domain-containing protein [Mycena capillaripes]
MLKLIEDTEGKPTEMTFHSSPSMSAARQAVDILSCAMLNGLLRVYHGNTTCLCPDRLPEILATLMRDDDMKACFPRASDNAAKVKKILASRLGAPVVSGDDVDQIPWIHSNSAESAHTDGVEAPGSGNTNKIWSTNSSEERERIRDFWLALTEDERRELVRVEKDTVLRKMQEEQKHGCGCPVCRRKRTAIEDELQVLYDAYYEDLEQYALYQQQYLSSNRTLPPPPGPGPFPGSVEVDRYGAVVAGFPPLTLLDSLSPKPNTPNNGNNGGKNRRARRRRKPAPTNTDRNPNNRIFNANARNEDDVYEEPDTKDEDKDEDENPDGVDMKYKIGAGVKGPISIPTVADDLLNDDGRRFLEMMEQLVCSAHLLFSLSTSSFLTPCLPFFVLLRLWNFADFRPLFLDSFSSCVLLVSYIRLGCNL